MRRKLEAGGTAVADRIGTSRRAFLASGASVALACAWAPAGLALEAGESVVEENERSTIRRELDAAVGDLISGCEALDFERAFRPFVQTDEFRMITADGLLWDFPTYLKANLDYLGGCSAFKLTTFDARAFVLAPELAVYQWTYRAEATLVSGGREVFEKAGATFVFRKSSDGWKAVCYHESTMPPRREDANPAQARS